MAIIGIILASNCSEIPENNDPIIGIWSNTQLNANTDTNKGATEGAAKNEWIFNDVYLGRYHSYDSNGSLVIITDFQWDEEDGVYTISYPGLENRTDDIVSMKELDTRNVLEDSSGKILAIRE